MKRRKRLRISRLREWSWKRRFLVFLSICSGIWVIIDPLFTLFGEPSPLAILGFWRYIFFVIIAIVWTVLIEVLNRTQLLGKLSFIPFTIILTKSGMKYQIEAPKDMCTADFVELFLKKIADNITVGNEEVLGLFKMFDNSLLVRNDNGNYDKVDPSRTLNENGIKKGDLCKIEARIKPDYYSTLYKETSITDPNNQIEIFDRFLNVSLESDTHPRKPGPFMNFLNFKRKRSKK